MIYLQLKVFKTLLSFKDIHTKSVGTYQPPIVVKIYGYNPIKREISKEAFSITSTSEHFLVNKKFKGNPVIKFNEECKTQTHSNKNIRYSFSKRPYEKVNKFSDISKVMPMGKYRTFYK